MLAQKLRQMRDNCGMTSKELAEKSGVPLGTVNRLLSSGNESGSIQTVYDLVKAMDGSLDELMGISPPETAAKDEQNLLGESKELLSECTIALQEANRKNRRDWIWKTLLFLSVLANIVFLLMRII
jgi:transcriptional regulator with XRE-family HTH domain